MDFYIPNLESIEDKYFTIKTPIEEYDEIVKNILTIQFEKNLNIKENYKIYIIYTYFKIMENSNFNRISATGLKSVEIDELNTSQIIINNEGLQYFHKYNIFLPTITEGFYNLQDELDNIMISNTTSDAEIIQLQSGLTTAQGNITTLGAGLTATSATATAALNLANQKQFIIFFQPPLRCDISTNLYLDYDTNYF